MSKIVKKKWNELLPVWQEINTQNKDATPYQSYELLTFTKKGKPYFKDPFRLVGLKELNLVLYNENEAIAIAPMLVKKKSNKYMVYLRGHFTKTDLLDFIHKGWSYDDFKFLIDGIKELLGNTSFLFGRISENSVTCGYLKEYFATGKIEEYDCYAIPVPQCYDDWFLNLHKSTRKNITRHMNRLDDDKISWKPVFYCCRPIEKNTCKAMMNLYARRYLEKNRLKFGPLSSVVTKLMAIGLSRDQITQWLNSAQNNFHVILYMNNEIAALICGLISKNQCIIFTRLAINLKYSKYGPGGLLLSCLMQNVIEQNKNGTLDIKLLDLGEGGGNGMEYKRMHGGERYNIYTFTD